MNTTKHIINSLSIVVIGLLVLWSAEAAAYDLYRTTDGSASCANCHPSFENRGALHDMHVGNQNMTNTCNLCHVSTGDIPKTWTSGAVGGESCRGCHGRDNGAGFTWGAGLRAHHVNAGAPADINGQTCTDAACHGSDPAPAPESTVPVYYLRDDVNVKDPCDATTALGEDFTGDQQGLDNDGDLLYDQNDGDCSGTGIGDVPRVSALKLISIYPNPAVAGITSVLFELAEGSDVVIGIYDVAGRPVLARKQVGLTAGPHNFQFNARDFAGKVLPTGIYVVRVTAGNQSVFGRFVFIK